ncbi:MAG: DUF3516 domain-containing protein, partial [Deltaproteobacteria bacterium]
LVQSIPDRYRTADVLDIVAFLRTIVTRVDSSLIEEWEDLQFSGRDLPSETDDAPKADPRRDPRAIRARLRSETHRFVKALALRDYEDAAACLLPDADRTWSPAELEAAMAPFHAAHGRIVLSQDARSARFTTIEPAGEFLWEVRQTLVDDEGDNDWVIEADARPDEGALGQPTLRLRRLGA